MSNVEIIALVISHLIAAGIGFLGGMVVMFLYR
jgi:hypothetical protein